MTRLLSGALCSESLSPPKRLFGVFPKLLHLSQSFPAVFRVSGCGFGKHSVGGSPNYSPHGNLIYVETLLLGKTLLRQHNLFATILDERSLGERKGVSHVMRQMKHQIVNLQRTMYLF